MLVLGLVDPEPRLGLSPPLTPHPAPSKSLLNAITLLRGGSQGKAAACLWAWVAGTQ